MLPSFLKNRDSALRLFATLLRLPREKSSEAFVCCEWYIGAVSGRKSSPFLLHRFVFF